MYYLFTLNYKQNENESYFFLHCIIFHDGNNAG